MRRFAIHFVETILFIGLASTAVAATPPLINYQALLTDSSGTPVADGNYSITFRILDAAAGGIELWSETQASVAIAGGNLSTLLGSVNPLEDGVFAGTEAYLEVQVDAEVLSPRSRLVSSGYAHRISTVDGAKAGQIKGALEVRADANPGPALKVAEAGGQSALEVNVDAAGNAAADMAGTMTLRSVAGGGTALKVADNGGTPALEVAVSAGGTAVAQMDGNMTLRAPSGGGTALTVAESGGAPAFEVMVDGAGVGSAEMSGGLTLHAEPGGSTPLKIVKASGGNSSFEITLDATGNAVASILNPVDEKAGPGAVQTKLMEFSSAGVVVFGATEADTNASILPDGNITTRGTLTIGDTTAATDLLVRSYKDHTAQFLNFNDGGAAAAVYGSALSTIAPYPVGIKGYAVPTDTTGLGGYFEGGQQGLIAYGEGGTTGVVFGLHGLGLGGNQAHGVRGFASGVRFANYGVRGYANGAATTNYGVYGSAVDATTNWAGYFEGDVNVTGTLSKSAGSFRIDHPLDPAHKYLQHSFVESPDMMNVYNGNVILDSRGEATVQLPTYFQTLNRDFRYQLTSIGAPGPNLYVAEEIADNRFRIAGGEPNSKVSWQVTGVRHDPYAEAHRIEVEVDKPPVERDKYTYPEFYGEPVEKSISFESRISPADMPRIVENEEAQDQ